MLCPSIIFFSLILLIVFVMLSMTNCSTETIMFCITTVIQCLDKQWDYAIIMWIWMKWNTRNKLHGMHKYILKPERSRTLKLVFIHFAPTSTCMIFFWANFIFWPPWTIVHGPKGKFGRLKAKMSKQISKTGVATPSSYCIHYVKNGKCLTKTKTSYIITVMQCLHKQWIHAI